MIYFEFPHFPEQNKKQVKGDFTVNQGVDVSTHKIFPSKSHSNSFSIVTSCIRSDLILANQIIKQMFPKYTQAEVIPQERRRSVHLELAGAL